jgi:adenine-specific DNA methylase
VNNTGELNLGDIFAIKRGFATGSNSFFILTEAQVKNGKFRKPS